jgi:hypothetical protein
LHNRGTEFALIVLGYGLVLFTQNRRRKATKTVRGNKRPFGRKFYDFYSVLEDDLRTVHSDRKYFHFTLPNRYTCRAVIAHTMNATLQLTDYLELTDTFACLRPVCEASLEEAIDLVDEAIRYCRDNEINGLLVDARKLTGFPSPTVTDRFWLASRWAETAGGRVVLAMVQRPEMTMPDKIGVTFAMNRGLMIDVFAEEADAMLWLQAMCS